MQSMLQQYPYPKVAQNKLLAIKQDNLSVMQYASKLHESSRYAPKYVATDHMIRVEK